MQFIQPDTIIPEPYNPQSWNRYAYGLNNPLRYTDPSGHAAVGDTNEAGCSGKGPKCIMDMYSAAGDEDGMQDSLRHFVIRHPDYTLDDDPELIDEEKAFVSVAMFQVAAQYGSSKEVVDTAGLLFIFGVIVNGVNFSPDDGGGGGSPRISPSESPVWKNFDSYQGKIRRSGNGRDVRYYQWDFTHGDIEVYDRNGFHLGSMNPITGEMYKPPVKGRTINLR